jgi:hypothetical protein
MADKLSGMQPRIWAKDIVHQAITAFRTSMKASADYHQSLSELDKGFEYHNNIARIYSALAK